MNPNLEILGNLGAERLSIVSFVVRRTKPDGSPGRYLHHNLVVALLNDLFGIQSRGGCSCAGPYGHRLLGIDIERSHEFEREIAHGCEGIKPGWVRVNFNYFVSDAVADYVIDAVHLVADHGCRAALRLPLRAGDRAVAAPGRSGRAAAAAQPGRLRPRDRRDDLSPARRARAGVGSARLPGGGARASWPPRGECPPDDDLSSAISADFEHLRWFELPAACLDPR